MFAKKKISHGTKTSFNGFLILFVGVYSLMSNEDDDLAFLRCFFLMSQSTFPSADRPLCVMYTVWKLVEAYEATTLDTTERKSTQ